jgi:hypothetical protein
MSNPSRCPRKDTESDCGESMPGLFRIQLFHRSRPCGKFFALRTSGMTLMFMLADP